MPRPFRVDVLTGTSDPYGSIDVKSRMSRIFTALLLLALIAGAVSAQETSEPDPRMVAVGSLSASNLYLSYLVLGTVADGYKTGSYNEVETRSIALETMFLNGNITDALEDMIKADIIDPAEREVVNEMIQSYVVLDNMARALISFVENEDDNGELYQAFRLEAWNRISDLLDLE
jgi:hypothetical protein